MFLFHDIKVGNDRFAYVVLFTDCVVFLNMKQHIAHITLLVKDYDEAIAFYTQKLYFTLPEDTVLREINYHQGSVTTASF